MDIVKKFLVKKFISCIKGACMDMTSEKNLGCTLDSFCQLIENIEESSESSSSVVSPDYLYFEAAVPNSTVTLKSNGFYPNLEYSIDGKNWLKWNFNEDNGYYVSDLISLSYVGDRVYLRGINDSLAVNYNLYSNFKLQGKVYCHGNIQTLLNGNKPSEIISKNYCYYHLFENCTSLISAPELPATTLAIYCYGYMFKGCTSLVSAPELPATTLADSCYYSMFQGCTSLTSAPELLATTLADLCYSGMFWDCTSLVSAPELPATNLVYGCYNNIFGDCVFNISNDGTTFNFNCAATLPQTVDGITYNTPYDLAEWMGNTNGLIDLDPNGLNFTMPNGGDITLTKNGAPTEVNFEYMIDGTDTWTPWIETNNVRTLTLTAGQKVYIRNTNITPTRLNLSFINDYYQFGFTDTVSAAGNINSMLCKHTNKVTQLSDWCYCRLFNGCIHLTSAPALPTTTLSRGCYNNMFQNCTSLTQAPVLPATTLVSQCYQGMFSECTSLTQAPTLLATTLAYGCYSIMFSGCTSLTSAPELPATTLVSECYNGMFSGCTSLTQAPELPATTLAYRCYYYMFGRCTSLIYAPELSATELEDGCYEQMFSLCTSLTQVPELPATTLALGCYRQMFYGCTSLTSAPELLATTLTQNCYDGMFLHCTFNMSDDGSTFNFDCDAILPQMVGDVTYNTPYDLATWMGNTNGFVNQ